MKRFILVLAFGWLTLLSAHSSGSEFTSEIQSDAIAPNEADTLAYIWELHKFQRDRYTSASQCWKIPELKLMAHDEELRMEILGTLLIQYEVPFPSQPDDKYTYSAGFLAEPFGIFYYTCWAIPPKVHEQSAYMEEVEIRDLRRAISESSEPALIGAYTGALFSAYDHLREMVAQTLSIQSTYHAQVLDQADVDEILSGDATGPNDTFEMTAGLNDTWFYPGTNGQGFFISVYPDCGMVMLAWLTFDTEAPDETATAHVGDPGQRWLTAQGAYTRNRAELTIFSSSGGFFDASPSTVRHEAVGSLELQFESCSVGSIVYSLPELDRYGVIPLQRVVPDNISACEGQN